MTKSELSGESSNLSAADAARLLQQADGIAVQREDLIDRRRLAWLSLIDASATMITVLYVLLALWVFPDHAEIGPLFLIPFVLWSALSSELRKDAGYRPRGALWHWLPEVLVVSAVVVLSVLSLVLDARVALPLRVAALVALGLYMLLAIMRARRQFLLASPEMGSRPLSVLTRPAVSVFAGCMAMLLGTTIVTVSVLELRVTVLWAVWFLVTNVAIGIVLSSQRLAPVVTAWRRRHWIAFAVGAVMTQATFWISLAAPTLTVPFGIVSGTTTLLAGLVALRGMCDDG